MKSILIRLVAPLPIALLLIAPLLIAGAAASVTVDRAAQRAGGIVVQTLAPISFAATRDAYGIVLDPAPLIALRARIVAAGIKSRFAGQNLSRARTLYGANHNIAMAQLQTAQDSDATARAAGAALRAEARTAWGPALGAGLIAGSPVIAGLAAGRTSLIEAAVTGQPIVAKADARATTATGATVTLHRLGRASRLPAGLIGQGVYFAGPPDLEIGMPISLRLPTGPAHQGVAIPASAILYLHGKRFVFIEPHPGNFAMVAIGGVIAMPRRHGAPRYFVGHGLRPGQIVATAGAGVLLSASLAKTPASETPASTPSDD